ncbi:hypothetical protein SAMN05192583_3537 [Sphingomonas gellani]|uniref:Uncharacterized protein n=1 Tax=Sphingomonas gellani TaxID=1166340 RepID=A0A1H8J8N7_9SPHN|nr:hypothetical protein SAMN05192583_3537 [Sphingomonas gellani]
MTDRLWKVTVSCLFPMGKPIEKVFEVHHATEEGARDAALGQEATAHGGSSIPTIVKIEEIR